MDEMILATCEQFKVPSVVIPHDLASVLGTPGGESPA
jgi:hypothetical protein